MILCNQICSFFKN